MNKKGAPAKSVSALNKTGTQIPVVATPAQGISTKAPPISTQPSSTTVGGLKTSGSTTPMGKASLNATIANMNTTAKSIVG